MAAAKPTSAMESGKVDNVVQLAEKHGWTSEVKKDLKSDNTTLRLTRGDEWVEVRWDGNSCKEMPAVSYQSQLRYVRNVAAAKRVLEADEATNAAPFQKRTAAKQGMRKAAPAKRVPAKPSKLVAGLNEADDQEVKDLLFGKKIVWLNSISGQFEEDRVLPEKNKNGHYYVQHEDDRRQVSFVGTYGFRSVKISAIAAIR